MSRTQEKNGSVFSDYLSNETVQMGQEFPKLLSWILKPVGRPNPVDIPLQPFQYLLTEPVPVAR